VNDARIVVIGAGEAGARAAIALRAEGHVGPLTLVGEEPHAPYERPPLSKASIVAPAPPPPPFIADAAGLAASGVERLAADVAHGVGPIRSVASEMLRTSISTCTGWPR